MHLNKILPICVLLILPTQQLTVVPPELKSRFGDALEAIFGMGVRLQALLQDASTKEAENFLVSPLSASIMIGQLMLGAEGEFLEQLHELISLPGEKVKNYSLNIYNKEGNESKPFPYGNLHLQLASLVREFGKSNNTQRLFRLESSNALFVQKSLKLYEQFVYESKLLYDTNIIRVNFKKPMQSINVINKWGSDHTNGLIKNVFNAPPPINTAAIFANAMYFLAEWEQPFSDELNIQDIFHVSNAKSTNATFMNGFLEFIPYSESKEMNCKMVVLPYKNKELGMYMILPNKGHQYEYDIRKFAQVMGAKYVLEMVRDLKDKDVVIKIPKLSLSNTFSILKPLQKYAAYKKATGNKQSNDNNVLDVLDDKIHDFENFKGNYGEDLLLTAAAKNQQFRISDIVQQMTFSINERGTEAAVVTSSLMDYSGGSKTFLANKPFMFFIRHEATTATLFWGTISNPSL